MIIDAQNLYSAAQVVAATGVSSNVIDHGQDRNFGVGEAMSIFIAVLAAAAVGAATLEVQLQADDNVGFATPVVVASTGVLAVADIPVGANISLPVPQGTRPERFSRLNYVITLPTGATLSVTLTAALIPRDFLGQVNQYYADNINIGA